MGDIANIGVAAIMRGKPAVDVLHNHKVFGGLNCEETLVTAGRCLNDHMRHDFPFRW
jgi:hypothetical protein